MNWRPLHIGCPYEETGHNRLHRPKNAWRVEGLWIILWRLYQFIADLRDWTVYHVNAYSAELEPRSTLNKSLRPFDLYQTSPSFERTKPLVRLHLARLVAFATEKSGIRLKSLAQQKPFVWTHAGRSFLLPSI